VFLCSISDNCGIRFRNLLKLTLYVRCNWGSLCFVLLLMGLFFYHYFIVFKSEFHKNVNKIFRGFRHVIFIAINIASKHGFVIFVNVFVLNVNAISFNFRVPFKFISCNSFN
jgi:hypothetical protein